MLFRANLFRLTNFAYRSASKRKLNFFINFIIFLSLFAITASFLSMFYENKIDKLDTKRTLLDSQKIMLANQISTIPSSLNMIDIIYLNNLYHNYNLLIDLLLERIFDILVSLFDW